MYLEFDITVANAPWGNNEADVHATRLALQCTGTRYASATTPAPTPPSVSTSIFAYRKTADGYTFSHVCSPVDLVEISTTEDDVNMRPQYVRRDYVDFLFPCQTAAEEAYEKLLDDIRFLGNEIIRYKENVGTTNITVRSDD